MNKSNFDTDIDLTLNSSAVSLLNLFIALYKVPSKRVMGNYNIDLI